MQNPTQLAPAAVVVFGRAAHREARKLAAHRDGSFTRSAAMLLYRHALAVARGAGVDVVLACDEDTDAPDDLRVIRQRGGGFGERFQNAVADAFGLGYHRVVVIGTDTPGLSSQMCRSALDVLATGDRRTVVIGPASDGGYYLLGLSRFEPRAFTGIPWRTRRVLAATRQALHGFRLVMLPRLTDADDASSLVRAVAEASSRSACIATLRRLLALARPCRACTSRAQIIPRFLSALIPTRRGPPLFTFS
jgi:2-phospho-L-lactate guanylyltransferase (CobY/MobA/RfbA family)